MTDLTIAQVADRLGIRRKTVHQWFADVTTRQHSDRWAKGNPSYTIPSEAVTRLQERITAWERDPDNITVDQATDLLGYHKWHVYRLLGSGKIAPFPLPAGLPQIHPAKYGRRVSKQSVLAYRERTKHDEAGT